MRVACVLVTHLRAKAEMRRRPHLKGKPVLIVDRNPSIGIPVVVDRFPEASGVMIGMTPEQAVSRHANAVVLDADEPYYRRVFEQALTSLQEISDRVEGTGIGTAYVRVDGLEDLYRGEAGIVSTLLNAVPEYLHPRVGVADAKFPAFVAARTCRAFGASRVPDDVRAFLAPHPIELLPVSGDVKIGLRRFGLHTMGNVASMRERVLADQFGSRRQAGVGAVKRNRRQAGRPYRVRGVDSRAHAAAVPLIVDAGVVRRSGRASQKSVRAA